MAWPVFHYTKASTALDRILLSARLQLGPTGRLNDPYESEPHLVTIIQDRDEDEGMTRAELKLFEQAGDLLRRKSERP